MGYGSTKHDSLTLYDIKYFVVNKDYEESKGRMIYDIAIIRLTQKIRIDLDEIPILNYDRLPFEISAIYYSFGRVEGDQKKKEQSASYLRVANLKTTAHFCPAESIVGHDFIRLCFWHTDGSKAARGDSGSPIFFHNDTIYGSIMSRTQLVSNAEHGGKMEPWTQGVRISFYYHWIKHLMYFDNDPTISKNKMLYCCQQEELDVYCIKKVRYREFVVVESYPIQSHLNQR